MAALHPLRTMRTISICIDRSVRSSSSFLLPFLQQQQRAASILSSLSDNPGAYKKKIRRGRGPSSGKGKTSGRGHKGQKQHGKVPAGFNGGQTPDHVVRGETGFYQHFRVDMSPLNLDRLQDWIDQGRIDPTKPITMKELNDSRCLHGVKDGVKLLARGSEKFKTPIQIVASRASATAIAAIEAAGGTVTTRFYTKSSIRRILRGQSTNDYEAHLSTTTGTVDPSRPFSQYRLPDPTGRKDIEYYRDPAHRGYLSHTVEKGEGPSLFFKTPHQKKHHKKPDATIARAEAPQTKEDKEANRIW